MTFSITLGGYALHCQDDGAPDLLAEIVDRAVLVERFDSAEREGRSAYLAVSRGNDWPFLVVTLRYESAGGGFHPGALLIPETNTLFLGAGTRLLAYDLTSPARLWEDYADAGFWRWERHGDTVLMCAELEISAWDLTGGKRWSRAVEPPWSCEVSGGVVDLNVMDRRSRFSIVEGPERA